MVLHLFCNQVTAVRFCHGAPFLSLCNVNLVDGLVWNEEAARSNRAMETNFNAAVAHQVEQQTENLCVAGSSPARGTNSMRL